MKVIIIGLGNFGGNLALKLTEDGHEVYGVDSNPAKVDLIENKINTAVGMDCSDESTIHKLPLDDCDLIVIAIGENVGASITVTAIVRKYYTGRIIVRSLNPIHKTVLEAMNITEIIEPEAEYAHELSNRIMVEGAVKSMDLPGDFEIIEILIPSQFVGQTYEQVSAMIGENITIITAIRSEEKANFLGSVSSENRVQGILAATYVFAPNDLLLIFGKIKNIDKCIQKYS
jgi:trk system potassium uptake protein TrkA